MTDVSTRLLSAGKLRRNDSRSRVWEDSDFNLCDLQVGVRSNNAEDWDWSTRLMGIGERRCSPKEHGYRAGPSHWPGGTATTPARGRKGLSKKGFGWAHLPVFWGRLRPGTIGGRPFRESD